MNTEFTRTDFYAGDFISENALRVAELIARAAAAPRGDGIAQT